MLSPRTKKPGRIQVLLAKGRSFRLGGDALARHDVNVIVASRLERLTRQFPDTPILISRALLDLLPDRLEVVCLGAHRLKGLADPVEVYGLLGLR